MRERRQGKKTGVRAIELRREGEGGNERNKRTKKRERRRWI